MKSMIELIRDLRVDHDLSQADVAEFLGTSQQHYSKYETGTIDLPLRHFTALLDYYQVSADYLLGLTNEDPAYTQRHRQALTPENREMLRRFESFLLNEQRTTAKQNR